MDQAKVPLELFQKQDATVNGSHNPETAQENRNSTFIEKDYLNLPSSNSKIETSRSTNLIIISADDNQPQKYSNNNITDNNSTSSCYSLELDSNNLPNGNSPLYDHPNTCDPLALVSPRPQVVIPPVVYPYQLFQVPLSQDIAQTAAHHPEQAKYRNKYGEHTVYEVCGTSTMNHPESNIVKRYFVNGTMFVIAAEKYEKYQNETFHKMEYVVELLNIPRSYTTRDLLNIYKKGPCYIKWCDDRHALLVTNSSEQATRALSTYHHLVQSRPMTDASPIATLVACNFKLFSPLYRQLSKRSENKISNSFEAICKTVPNATNSTENYSNRATEQLLHGLKAIKSDENTAEDGQLSDKAIVSSSENMQTETTDNNGDCNTTTFTETSEAVIHCDVNDLASGIKNVNLNTWKDIFARRTTLINKVSNIFRKNASIIIATENYDYYQNKMFDTMGHIIELFNIPKTYQAKDLLNIYQEEPRYIIWCDAAHALLVTGSTEEAQRALLVHHEIIKSSAMVSASLLATAVACELVLLPASGICNNKTSIDSDVTAKTVGIVGEKTNDYNILQLNKESTTTPTISSGSEQVKYAANKSTATQLAKQCFNNPTTAVYPMKNYIQYQDPSWQNLAHIIEIYNFPPVYRTGNLLSIYRDRPRYIKWCDSTHALLVTSSAEQDLNIEEQMEKTEELADIEWENDTSNDG